MGRFTGRFAWGASKSERDAHDADLSYLMAWGSSHTGVEGFVEPANKFNDLTIVLVDIDGNWTRRALSGPKAAQRLGRELEMPVYDVLKVGYPKRMRDKLERARILRKRAAREELLRDMPRSEG
ncbi:hypothetical protein [Tomitella biformata]|uniref:hypothetical protein n=1 Tax=Tomitella biformata TaxID=630403 RepID=UPI0004677D1B|nr:hypothetical protein [Tomitella biformata]